ncbi:MAG: amidohydrolase [Acidobacteria bacterium]|nr:amidohydrolase [Acidobacteriota bacterium]
MTLRILFLPLAVCLVAFGQPADLVLRHGKVVTLEAGAPVVQALAARGERIVAVGSDAQMAKLIGPKTKVIDLGGKTAIPGFIEGHAHFTMTGQFRMSLNLREARSWDDIVAQVRRAAAQAKPGDWIVGRGWHQSKWSKAPEPNVDGFPIHTELSKAAPNNPVLLNHASGHASFINEAAMKAARITRDTASPSGGAILKDAQGNPTGLLQERAQGLVTRAYAEWQARRSAAERAADLRKSVDLAVDECLAKGVTSFQDAGSPFETVDLLKSMAERGDLKLRLWMMLRASNTDLGPKLDQYRMIGAGGNYLTVRAIKKQIDGALGPRGAWLLAPYADLPADAPNRSGMNTEDPADIRRTAELAIAHGYQLCVHAIGDRANREALDIFEDAFKAHPDKKGLRWRIEHAQHLSAADIPRFGQLGVIAAMQGVHCTSDAPYVLARLGHDRAEEGAYVWQKLMKSGAVVGNGTDSPVEDVSPLASYYSTVSRKLKDGSVFFSDQRMSREEALRSYTIQNAYAAFEENLKGTLKVGKLADVTVLSRDILTIPEDEIPSTDVLYTIVGGKVRYEATR